MYDDSFKNNLETKVGSAIRDPISHEVFRLLFSHITEERSDQHDIIGSILLIICKKDFILLS